MNRLSLPEILRYLVIGLVVIGVGYVCEQGIVTCLLAKLGPVGSPLFAFVIGSLTFVVYRATLYNFVILRFLDFIHKDNVRDILMSRYKIPDRYRAEIFWKIVQVSELKDSLESINLGSAGTHLLYMTCGTTLIGSAYLLFNSCISARFCWLLLISLVCGVAAIASDYFIETLVTFLLRSIGEKKVDALAKELGFEKLNGHEKANRCNDK